MTDQPALWTEPPWTAAWPAGTRVRNRYTGATGTVERVEPGVRLHILWESRGRWPDYRCSHGSDLNLEREAAA